MGLKTTHFPCELSQLEKVRNFVETICASASPDIKKKLALAIDEAFTNIFKHGHPPSDVILEADLNDEGILFILKDQGIGFDPTTVRPPDFSGNREGGFGLYIIEQVADHVTYIPKTSQDGWNELRIFRRMP